ncbi:homocysteine S-methyltransferase [Powellomyces hirtus]|nr:homocysteine S-methyltransferase [Powellomyces hirtus]
MTTNKPPSERAESPQPTTEPVSEYQHYLSEYRHRLPQLLANQRKPFLTDGSVETYYIHTSHVNLPERVAFAVMDDSTGKSSMIDYFQSYLDIAQEFQTGFIIETPTLRAHHDIAVAKLCYYERELEDLWDLSVKIATFVGREYWPRIHVVCSGCVGPRAEGFSTPAAQRMTVAEARSYHLPQIAYFGATVADMCTAGMMNYVEEAVGMVMAAWDARMPIVVAFALDVDGCLPVPPGEETTTTRTTLQQAIAEVDAATDHPPVYYVISCMHPTHMKPVLEAARGQEWVKRVGGIRANASRQTHRELQEMTHLEGGDKDEWARQYREVVELLPELKVLGGCCGTDWEHMRRIAEECIGRPK